MGPRLRRGLASRRPRAVGTDKGTLYHTRVLLCKVSGDFWCDTPTAVVWGYMCVCFMRQDALTVDESVMRLCVDCFNTGSKSIRLRLGKTRAPMTSWCVAVVMMRKFGRICNRSCCAGVLFCAAGNGQVPIRRGAAAGSDRCCR